MVINFCYSIFTLLGSLYSDHDSEDDEVPLWKRALMKKKTIEQKQQESEDKQKVPAIIIVVIALGGR